MTTQGYRYSPESRAKMSMAHCGKIAAHMVGNKYAEGHKVSKEARAKMAAAERGQKNHNWKGDRRISVRGYIFVLCHGHPFADRKGYVLEHRLVMETHLGKTLLPTEVVHHINGIVNDNRIENLMLFSSSGKHLGHHVAKRKLAKLEAKP